MMSHHWHSVICDISYLYLAIQRVVTLIPITNPRSSVMTSSNLYLFLSHLRKFELSHHINVCGELCWLSFLYWFTVMLYYLHMMLVCPWLAIFTTTFISTFASQFIFGSGDMRHVSRLYPNVDLTLKMWVFVETFFTNFLPFVRGLAFKIDCFLLPRYIQVHYEKLLQCYCLHPMERRLLKLYPISLTNASVVNSCL